MIKTKQLALGAFGLALFSAGFAQAAPAGVTQKPFGTLADGGKATLFTLTNSKGMRVEITNYGATVTSIYAPDRKGNLGDIALGFETLDDYVKKSPYIGSTIGRYGNRIAKGQFSIDGKKYQVAVNNSPNHLHGGVRGFDKRIWKATPGKSKNGPTLDLVYFSPAGEESYPGNLNARVRYTLDNSNRLHIDYRAVTDAPTLYNPTNHAYFNLAGAGNGTILNHKLQINARRYTPIDPTSIPFGNLATVVGTPFDFLTPHTIGERINANNTQLKNGQGYDHNFVLNGKMGTMRRVARVTEPTTGRILTVSTTEPGIQLYSGNFLDNQVGKNGKTYEKRSGFCLETQHYPDSPNQPKFPTTVLRPGQTYTQHTIYGFSAR